MPIKIYKFINVYWVKKFLWLFLQRLGRTRDSSCLGKFNFFKDLQFTFWFLTSRSNKTVFMRLFNKYRMTSSGLNRLIYLPGFKQFGRSANAMPIFGHSLKLINILYTIKLKSLIYLPAPKITIRGQMGVRSLTARIKVIYCFKNTI